MLAFSGVRMHTLIRFKFPHFHSDSAFLDLSFKVFQVKLEG